MSRAKSVVPKKGLKEKKLIGNQMNLENANNTSFEISC
jgi:hypothetical protein